MLKDFKYVGKGKSSELSYFCDFYQCEHKNYKVEGESEYRAIGASALFIADVVKTKN
jgi:hypothetical protein